MNLLDHLDKDHAEIVGFLPEDLFDLSDVDAMRARLTMLGEATPTPELPASVSIEEHVAPGYDGDPDVALRVYRPEGVGTDAAALFWMHGGGLVMGDYAMDEDQCANWALDAGIVVVSVEYRLAPEHPFPAPVNDCYAGLSWLAANASDVGVSAQRIMIGGASAGGGLAACLALVAKERGGPEIAFQFLVYPMLDDRNQTPSSHAVTDLRFWNRSANEAGWNAYLAGQAGADSIPAIAAAARANDLSGLPPAYINVGSLDLFVDEDTIYANALRDAGVAVELHVYPGAFHASNKLVAHSELSMRWAADEVAALKRAAAATA
jgi:acetyl esterase/lipase